LDEAKSEITLAKNEIEVLAEKVEELETKPFVNVSESDMTDAETTLTEELEAKYEAAFDLAKEKFNNTFELVVESNASVISELEIKLDEATEIIDTLSKKVADLEDKLDETETELSEALVEDKIADAIATTEERMRAEAAEKIEAIKESLVTSTEIFLEQELSEVKADKDELMKETQGRELLESIKGLVKQYWDIDSEVAEEILEMKKESEAKVEQYKDMLKKEHKRLEESQQQVNTLKKKVIVESKSSVLSADKKEALEKLAENIDADKLETKIDALMESVIDTFNAGFSKKAVVPVINKKINDTSLLTESVNTAISSGNSDMKPSDELANLLALAGVK